VVHKVAAASLGAVGETEAAAARLAAVAKAVVMEEGSTLAG